MEEEQVKKQVKRRLSPEATILLTIATMAIAVVIVGAIHFIVTTF